MPLPTPENLHSDCYEKDAKAMRRLMRGIFHEADVSGTQNHGQMVNLLHETSALSTNDHTFYANFRQAFLDAWAENIERFHDVQRIELMLMTYEAASADERSRFIKRAKKFQLKPEKLIQACQGHGFNTIQETLSERFFGAGTTNIENTTLMSNVFQSASNLITDDEFRQDFQRAYLISWAEGLDSVRDVAQVAILLSHGEILTNRDRRYFLQHGLSSSLNDETFTLMLKILQRLEDFHLVAMDLLPHIVQLHENKELTTPNVRSYLDTFNPLQTGELTADDVNTICKTGISLPNDIWDTLNRLNTAAGHEEQARILLDHPNLSNNQFEENFLYAIFDFNQGQHLNQQLLEYLFKVTRQKNRRLLIVSLDKVATRYGIDLWIPYYDEKADKFLDQIGNLDLEVKITQLAKRFTQLWNEKNIKHIEALVSKTQKGQLPLLIKSMSHWNVTDYLLKEPNSKLAHYYPNWLDQLSIERFPLELQSVLQSTSEHRFTLIDHLMTHMINRKEFLDEHHKSLLLQNFNALSTDQQQTCYNFLINKQGALSIPTEFRHQHKHIHQSEQPTSSYNSFTQYTVSKNSTWHRTHTYAQDAKLTEAKTRSMNFFSKNPSAQAQLNFKTRLSEFRVAPTTASAAQLFAAADDLPKAVKIMTSHGTQPIRNFQDDIITGAKDLSADERFDFFKRLITNKFTNSNVQADVRNVYNANRHTYKVNTRTSTRNSQIDNMNDSINDFLQNATAQTMQALLNTIGEVANEIEQESNLQTSTLLSLCDWVLDKARDLDLGTPKQTSSISFNQ